MHPPPWGDQVGLVEVAVCGEPEHVGLGGSVGPPESIKEEGIQALAIHQSSREGVAAVHLIVRKSGIVVIAHGWDSLPRG